MRGKLPGVDGGRNGKTSTMPRRKAEHPGSAAALCRGIVFVLMVDWRESPCGRPPFKGVVQIEKLAGAARTPRRPFFKRRRALAFAFDADKFPAHTRRIVEKTENANAVRNRHLLLAPAFGCFLTGFQFL